MQHVLRATASFARHVWRATLQVIVISGRPRRNLPTWCWNRYALPWSL